jgi:purine-binding chemotaxis protein CheW
METIVESGSHAVSPGTAGGKFLTFMLADEEFGVDIVRVVEIIGVVEITVVPHTPHFLRGVVNLRGKVIPVVDLRAKLRLPDADHNEQTCIIVTDVGMLTGILVDAVRDVYDIAGQDIAPPPALGGGVDTDLILGMGKVNGEVKILLDIERVLHADELVALPGAAD